MADPKDCPLCGSTMRLKRTKTVVRVPGNPTTTTRTTPEWVCPECDYFEEAEEAGS
jgi:YgiT-type zinc finger domain-containing protein